MKTSRICILISFSVLLFLQACKEDAPDTSIANTLFDKKENSELGIDFINNISDSKSFNIFNYRNFYNGGGVGIADINNDGLSDIFLTSNLGDNKLYLNKGGWKFEDISQIAGISESEKWSTGVAMIDINGDNLIDIYICNAGNKKGSDQRNSLFINQGDLTFKEMAASYGLDDSGYTTHAAFADFDRDGDLDVYLLNNSFIPVNTLNYSNKRTLRAPDWPVKEFLKGGGDKFLRNENGFFVDVSEAAGIYGSLIGFGLGVTVGDVNGDDYPDIYVSNDFFERDYLYINDTKGGFTEDLESRIKHLSHSSMGADMADINNDGASEIFVTDMLPDDEYRLKTSSTFDDINLKNLKVKQGFYNQYMHNTLQLNDGQGQFQEIAYYSDVAASDWSWGALIFDADNDSYSDIIVCNGIYHDVIDQDFIDFFANEVIAEMALTGEKEEIDSVINRMPSVPIPNKAFRNLGNLKFKDSAVEWGLEEKSFSNGAAYGDLDNDGDLDLVINNVNQQVLIYENRSEHNWISFSLSYKSPNTKAIGSKIKVFVKDKILSRELIPTRGFQSSVDYKITVGLAKESEIDSVVLIWPDGLYSRFGSLDVNEHHILDFENIARHQKHAVPFVDNPFLAAAKNPFIKHREDDHIDFYYERNIPLQLSKEGPSADIADVNNDGFLDLVIGGAAGQPTQLYYGSKNGFSDADTSQFLAFKAFEDCYVKFFDADGDGDKDLIIGSGGNNPQLISRAFRDRIHFNTNGKFELNFNAIPPKALNTSVILPHDFDGDGDEDLFVGSRSIPGTYGVSPGSFIYVNNGKGQFFDATESIIPELAYAGMVTDAIWADVLPNPGKELIIVGEWMAPKILSFNGSKFDIVDTDLSKYSGWWQSISATDINNDGLTDLVLGNLGENFYLEADSSNPLLMWINDFDGNNSIEKIITRRIAGKDVPVAMKRDLTDQINILKKQNLKHSSYATKAINELFTEEQLKASTIKQINYLKSMVVINRGEGTFEISEFMREMQLSCINTILSVDINADGYDDLISGGNNLSFLPQFSQLDACNGKLLINDKQGGYQLLPNKISGLNFNGVVRELHYFELDSKKYILALINDAKPELYEVVHLP